eukprot:3362590-Prymnesium_polylepis.1
MDGALSDDERVLRVLAENRRHERDRAPVVGVRGDMLEPCPRVIGSMVTAITPPSVEHRDDGEQRRVGQHGRGQHRRAGTHRRREQRRVQQHRRLGTRRCRCFVAVVDDCFLRRIEHPKDRPLLGDVRGEHRARGVRVGGHADG